MSFTLSYTVIWHTLQRSWIIDRLNAPIIRITAQSGHGNVQITHSMPPPYLTQYTEKKNAVKKKKN